MVIKKELSKSDRIKKEVNRIKRLLKVAEVDDNRIKVLEGLIQRAGFLRIACEDLEEYLLEHGHTEPFQQSTNLPPYNKIRAEATLHASSVKDYKAICKQITDSFEQKVNVNLIDDGFESFLAGK